MSGDLNLPDIDFPQPAGDVVAGIFRVPEVPERLPDDSGGSKRKGCRICRIYFLH